MSENHTPTTTTPDNNETAQGDPQDGEPQFPLKMQRAIARLQKMKHCDGKTLAENFMFPLLKAMYEELDGAVAQLEEDIDNKIDVDELDVDDAVTAALADSPDEIKEISEYVLWTMMMFQQIYTKAGWLAVNPDDKTQVAFTDKADTETKEAYQKISEMGARIANKIKEVEARIEEYETEETELTNSEAGDGIIGDDLRNGTVAPAQPHVVLDGTVGTLSSSVPTVIDSNATPETPPTT